MSLSLKWRAAQFLEIHWWKRYLMGKDREGYLAWKSGYWREFLSKLDGQPGLDNYSAVLDAGCGPAGIFIILDGCEVTAVDPLLDKYESTLVQFRKEDYPYTEFVTSTIERFRSEKRFQVIFCLNAINHVAALKESIDNLFAHLAPGGKLVLSIDCHRYPLIKHIFRMIPWDALHPHQHDLDDYRELIASSGGKIIREITSRRGRMFDYCVLVAEKE